MTAPTPRPGAALDVSVDVLLAAMAVTHSESDLMAYSLDRELLAHPERCSTDTDYSWWTPAMGCCPAHARKAVAS